MKPKPPKPITKEEWLASLDAVGEFASFEGQSVRDLCQVTGKSKGWILGRLAALGREGKLIVGRSAATRLDGQRSIIPVYSLRVA
jgi:hypothetical protein